MFELGDKKGKNTELTVKKKKKTKHKTQAYIFNLLMNGNVFLFKI